MFRALVPCNLCRLADAFVAKSLVYVIERFGCFRGKGFSGHRNLVGGILCLVQEEVGNQGVHRSQLCRS
jgi:hypothetical protein